MGIVSWIVFGAIVGWLAGKLAGGESPQGCVTNIVIGIAGAMVAGAGYTLITGEDWLFRFNLPSLGVAVVGAVALVLVLRRLDTR